MHHLSDLWGQLSRWHLDRVPRSRPPMLARWSCGAILLCTVFCIRLAFAQEASPHQTASSLLRPPLIPESFHVLEKRAWADGLVHYHKLKRPTKQSFQEALLQNEASLQAQHVIHVLAVNMESERLQLELSPESEKGRIPSQFSGSREALATVNASFYDPEFRALGLTVSAGQKWTRSRDTKKYITFHCARRWPCQFEETDTNAHSSQAQLVVSGRPKLVQRGQPRPASKDTACPSFCGKTHPRTGLGVSRDGKWLLIVVAEGRNYPVRGLSLSGFAELLHEVGAHEGFNLDGGGSSTLLLEGKRVSSRPFNEPGERPVANVLQVHLDRPVNRAQ